MREVEAEMRNDDADTTVEVKGLGRRHSGVAKDADTRALERRNLLDAATATDEDTRAHVERLELLADESRLPAGDELIADIERFLREGGDEGGGGEPEGGSRLH